MSGDKDIDIKLFVYRQYTMGKLVQRAQHAPRRVSFFTNYQSYLQDCMKFNPTKRKAGYADCLIQVFFFGSTEDLDGLLFVQRKEIYIKDTFLFLLKYT